MIPKQKNLKLTIQIYFFWLFLHFYYHFWALFSLKPTRKTPMLQHRQQDLNYVILVIDIRLVLY